LLAAEYSCRINSDLDVPTGSAGARPIQRVAMSCLVLQKDPIVLVLLKFSEVNWVQTLPTRLPGESSGQITVLDNEKSG
jgi:hypothetical protein